MVTASISGRLAVSKPLPEDFVPPFETLFDVSEGLALPLPAELEDIYGSLRFPAPHGRPYVIGNLVTSLDGVVSLGIPGQASGKEISGFNMHDRLLMGILRAAADAVVSGAGTLRASPDHVLTPEHAFPSMEGAYRQLRATLGKARVPLNVVVSGSGDLAPDLSILGGEVPALVVTTEEGLRRITQPGKLSKQAMTEEVTVDAVESSGPLTARAILDAITRAGYDGLVLVEGGPHLMASFFAEGCLDEMFLTLSPQVVGRDSSWRPGGHPANPERPGLVAGRSLAPERPAWGKLVGVRRAGSHLFLRYKFGAPTWS
ncbi:MAG: dihydrofolate reductase family protein [Chloroflexi bacterium]|nr:dihydrofolate reductase family protein [Chloroflexota bacterium]